MVNLWGGRVSGEEERNRLFLIRSGWLGLCFLQIVSNRLDILSTHWEISEKQSCKPPDLPES